MRKFKKLFNEKNILDSYLKYLKKYKESDIPHYIDELVHWVDVPENCTEEELKYVEDITELQK